MTTLTDNTEAWERAASNATAYMHPADDQEGAGAIFWLGVAAVLGLGLGIALPSIYFYRISHDTAWLGAAMLGGLLLAFDAAAVWRLWEVRK